MICTLLQEPAPFFSRQTEHEERPARHSHSKSAWAVLQGTFYGQQGGQNDWATCSYGSKVSNTLKLDWANNVAANVAMNDCQFQEGLACGMCLYFRGTGRGLGMTPLSIEWQFGFVDNL